MMHVPYPPRMNSFLNEIRAWWNFFHGTMPWYRTPPPLKGRNRAHFPLQEKKRNSALLKVRIRYNNLFDVNPIIFSGGREIGKGFAQQAEGLGFFFNPITVKPKSLKQLVTVPMLNVRQTFECHRSFEMNLKTNVLCSNMSGKLKSPHR